MARNRRRANGEGSVYQRADGKWVAAISLNSRTPSGSRRRRSRVCDRRSDALAALREMQRDAEAGESLASASLTVGEYLTRWLEDSIRPNLAPNTFVSYRGFINNHIIPRVGDLPIAKINALHIERFVSDMNRDGVPSYTRRKSFRTLRIGLNRAVRLGLIPSNPMSQCEAPKHKPRKIDPFDQSEVVQILDDVAASPLQIVFELAFSLGMRRGEILGLHWEDVDFENTTIRVHQQLCFVHGHPPEYRPPKAGSERTLVAPKRVVAALNERRAILLREGQAKCERVVSAPQGGLLWPQELYSKSWNPTLERLEIRHRGFHHARHTYATHQLRAGVPLHVVSRILGHANTAMTLRVYAHLLEGDQELASESIDRLYG